MTKACGWEGMRLGAGMRGWSGGTGREQGWRRDGGCCRAIKAGARCCGAAASGPAVHGMRLGPLPPPRLPAPGTSREPRPATCLLQAFDGGCQVQLLAVVVVQGGGGVDGVGVWAQGVVVGLQAHQHIIQLGLGQLLL